MGSNQNYKIGYLYFSLICALLGCFIAWLLVSGLLNGEVLVTRKSGPDDMVSRVEYPVFYWGVIVFYSILSFILLAYGPAWDIREYFKKPKLSSFMNNEAIPACCTNCKKEGFIEPETPESSCLVKCSICNSESSYVWCEKCEIGGDLFEYVKDHKTSWKCPECKEQHKLPNDFYKHSIYIKFEKIPNKRG